MKYAIILLLALGCACIHPAFANADIINGGFETGDFTGWTTTGVASAQGTSIFGPLSIAPFAGSRQASLSTVGTTTSPVSAAALETFLNINTGTLGTLAALNGNNLPVTTGSAIKQLVSVNEGDTLTLRWNFATQDYPPFDFSFLVIGGTASTLATPASIGNTSGNTTASGYQTYSYTFDASGTYLIGLGVTNTGDTGVLSGLYVDGLSITPAAVTVIPEPDSIALFGVAFVAAISSRYRHLIRKLSLGK